MQQFMHTNNIVIKLNLYLKITIIYPIKVFVIKSNNAQC